MKDFLEIYTENSVGQIDMKSAVYRRSVEEWEDGGGLVSFMLNSEVSFSKSVFEEACSFPDFNWDKGVFVPVIREISYTSHSIATLPSVKDIIKAGFTAFSLNHSNDNKPLYHKGTLRWYSLDEAAALFNFGIEKCCYVRAF